MEDHIEEKLRELYANRAKALSTDQINNILLEGEREWCPEYLHFVKIELLARIIN